MTKGTSTRRKSQGLLGIDRYGKGRMRPLYGNFDPGNNDKLMITYNRDRQHDYTTSGACGVMYEGNINFLGGYTSVPAPLWRDHEGRNHGSFSVDFSRQHFVIELQRNGQMVKMTKKKDLEERFTEASCNTFAMTYEYFPWFQTNVVILCFDWHHSTYFPWHRSCYSFDGDLHYIGDSNYTHRSGGLAKYRGNLLSVNTDLGKTEILGRVGSKTFSWSDAEPDFKFKHNRFEKNTLFEHFSLVTVESSDINKEYVLLIGGRVDEMHRKREDLTTRQNVFKFNGTWSPFGKLKHRRYWHTSIYWNGAVYLIGGKSKGSISLGDQRSHTMATRSDYNDEYMKMEIWNIADSPDQFKTTKTWPNLNNWLCP